MDILEKQSKTKNNKHNTNIYIYEEGLAPAEVSRDRFGAGLVPGWLVPSCFEDSSGLPEGFPRGSVPVMPRWCRPLSGPAVLVQIYICKGF